VARVDGPTNNGTPAGGWFPVARRLTREHGRRVGAIGVALYVAIASYADDGGAAFPSYDTLAADLGIGRRTVILYAQKLEDSGLIRVERRANRVNVFRLADPTEGCSSCTPGGARGAANAPQGAANAPQGAGAAPERQSLKDNHLTREEPPTPNPSLPGGADPVEIPPPLDAPEFRKVWADWLAYRRQKRKPYAPQTAERVLKKLADLGPAGAAAAVEASLEHGWQGLPGVHFQPRPAGPNGAPAAGGNGLHPRTVAMLEHFHRKGAPP
jgi:biotin operon repressor